MNRLLIPAVAMLGTFSAPAIAQSTMHGMAMPAEASPEAKQDDVKKTDPHAGHRMAPEPKPATDHGAPHGHSMPETAPPPISDPHAGHDMSTMPTSAEQKVEIGDTPAPAPPSDHAADAIFDPAEMAAARRGLRKEHGAFQGKMILIDLAEYQARKGRDGYRWEGEAWFGSDINRLLIKSEGEGSIGEKIEDVEVQALYSRAITPFWNAHAGIRHDITPNPSRTYAVIGVEGVAPYWLHVTSQLFLSDKGDVRARVEASYDERITQRLIFQPRAEFNLAAQNMPTIAVGSGVSDFEIGARLRYEIVKEFAPYIGIEWSKKTGDTARFARLAGGDPDVVNLVAGVRFWF